MVVSQIEVEIGFRKADINNIPLININTIFNFATYSGVANRQLCTDDYSEYSVDYVQLRRIAEINVCEVNGLVFLINDFSNVDCHANVSLKIDEKQHEIIDCQCSLCPDNNACQHIIIFIFWLHRKSSDKSTTAVCDFWGHEFENLAAEQNSTVYRIRDLFISNEARSEADLNISAVNNEDGQLFLDAILEDLRRIGASEGAFYRQCEEVVSDFEPVFIHHILLNSAENNVKDVNGFIQYMKKQSARGLLENLNYVTKNIYKSPLWLEAQYMRLRCSMIHRIATRKSPDDDEQIFNMLFCHGRDRNIDERRRLKQHKRFILKQTEKLKKKTYYNCGLLFNKNHPYIVAAPDGITDDHIVEIKAPKTEKDFEKYLEASETISPKYMAQIQMQMYIAKVPKALFCVLSSTFNMTGVLHYIWVKADNEFVSNLLTVAEDFWKDVVFPRLHQIYQLS